MIFGLRVSRALILAAITPALALGACQRTRTERDPSTPSGFAVPRYLVLRFDEINGRAGPSEDHEVLWTYRARGLPVQVIAETEQWRRICDPEGGIAWVASRMLEGGRAVVRNTPGEALIRRSPAADGAVVGALPQNARADLGRCEEGWCRIKAGGISGWTRQDEIWGADEGFQCEGLPAPEPIALDAE